MRSLHHVHTFLHGCVVSGNIILLPVGITDDMLTSVSDNVAESYV